MGESDPVFMRKYGKELEKDPSVWADSSVWHGKAHRCVSNSLGTPSHKADAVDCPYSWSKIPWLIETWKKISGGKPFALKGIQCVEDAELAVKYGCDGIVVSKYEPPTVWQIEKYL